MHLGGEEGTFNWEEVEKKWCVIYNEILDTKSQVLTNINSLHPAVGVLFSYDKGRSRYSLKGNVPQTSWYTITHDLPFLKLNCANL